MPPCSMEKIRMKKLYPDAPTALAGLLRDGMVIAVAGSAFPACPNA